MEKRGWFYVAFVGLGLSVISLFTTIVTYVTTDSKVLRFNIIDLIGGNKDFDHYVLNQYTGPILWNITGAVTAILAVLAVAALLCAGIGLMTLRAQRPNTWQFVLTILGLAGVAIPSIVLIICVIAFGGYFEGTIGFGLAPVITPIAMIVCIAAVIRRRNTVQEQLQRELEAKGMIWKPRDL